MGFIQRLRVAVAFDLDYSNRKDKPNVPVEEFKRALAMARGVENLRWTPRNSNSGRFGMIGEVNVFKCNVRARVFNRDRLYFVKGYFAPANQALQGVAIQSFREESN